MLIFKIPTLLNSKNQFNHMFGTIMSLLTLGVTALIVYYNYTRFTNSRIFVQESQISLQTLSAEEIRIMSPEFMIVYKDDPQTTISWTSSNQIEKCSDEASNSYFDYDPTISIDKSLSYYCFIITSVKPTDINFVKRDLSGNSILFNVTETTLKIISKAKQFNKTSYEYIPPFIAILDHSSQDHTTIISSNVDIFKIDNNLFQTSYSNFYSLLQWFQKLAIDYNLLLPSLPFRITFDFASSQTISSSKITKFLSKTLGMISILFLIVTTLSKPITEYLYLKHILENYFSSQELALINNELELNGEDSYKICFSFINFTLQIWPFKSANQNKFSLIKSKIYNKISLEQIILRKVNKDKADDSNQLLVKAKSSRGLLENFDLLTDHRTLYFNQKSSYSNNVSLLLSILSVLIIVSALYFFGKDFITNSNPTLFTNTRYVSQNEISLEDKVRKSQLPDYPFAISIPTEYIGTLQLLLTDPFKLLDETICTAEQLKVFNITANDYFTHICLNGHSFFNEKIFTFDSQYVVAFVNIGNPQRLKAIKSKLTNQESSQVQQKADKITKYLVNGDKLTIELKFITTDVDLTNNSISLYSKSINYLTNTYDHLELGDVKVKNGNYLNVGLFYKTLFVDDKKWSLITSNPDEYGSVAFWYGISGTLSSMEYELLFFINFGPYYFEDTLEYPKALEVFNK